MLIPNTQHLDRSLGNPENSVEWAQQIVPPTNGRLTSSGDRHNQKGFSLHVPLQGLAMKVVANHSFILFEMTGFRGQRNQDSTALCVPCQRPVFLVSRSQAAGIFLPSPLPWHTFWAS